MSWFSRLFGGRHVPKFCIYVDKSEKGNYSARVVLRGDPGIKMGKPKDDVFLTPIDASYGSSSQAVKDMAVRLKSVGLECAEASVCVEAERNKLARSHGRVREWGVK